MHKIRNKKRYVIIGVTIFIIIMLSIFYKFIDKKNKSITSVNDFSNVQELVEYNECKYIKTVNSKEDGYKKDIYIEFSKPPIEKNGTNNEILYKNLTSQVAGKMLGTNFRIIDESKDIIIRVQFKDNAVSLYTINNDEKYFESLKTRYQASSYKEDKITDMQIQSSELALIINNDWKTTKLNLGTMDSTCSGYNIYFDEGYKIREIYSQVFNIIFTKQYTKNVFENIKTGMKNEDIIKILGNPIYEDLQNNIIGYKTDWFYTFFHDGEISIYRIEQNYDTTQFAKLVTEYNNTNDYNAFISKLTDLWPDYDVFERDSNYVNLIYSLKGVEIRLNTIEKNGITIYNNFNGQITEDISLEDIKNGSEIPSNVYIELGENLIWVNEKYRVESDEYSRNPAVNLEKLSTSKYEVIYSMSDSGYKNVKFYSKNKTNIDSELPTNYINQLYKINDDEYIYSISGKGIYKYIPETAKVQTIIEGSKQFKINKIQNNIIYYDNTQINIK